MVASAVVGAASQKGVVPGPRLGESEGARLYRDRDIRRVLAAVQQPRGGGSQKVLEPDVCHCTTV